MVDVKKWMKVTVMHFRESCYYSQNGENGSILDLKSILLNFYLNLLNRFF